jgi:GAF domain-containing protein
MAVMVENLVVVSNEKHATYRCLIPKIKALVGNETDTVANLANVSAAIKEAFGFLWVGFYLVKESELVLGPFQGPVACTRIQHGKGVCGTSWSEKKTLIIDDVDKYPGHIACNMFSKSEIVVPIIKKNRVVGVLDVDSSDLAAFDAIDEQKLNELCAWLVTTI